MLNLETMTKSDSRYVALLKLLTERSVCRGSFILASGAKSDLYVDAKLTTHDPRGAQLVGEIGWELIKDRMASEELRVDSVGGLTMGADSIALTIGLASYLADPDRAVQTFSVRKAAKSHGRHKLIEGNYREGDSVVVIDDVITTGASTLQAIAAIRAAGGTIPFALVLVDREEGGRQKIEQEGVPVISFFTRRDLLAANPREQQHSTAA